MKKTILAMTLCIAMLGSTTLSAQNSIRVADLPISGLSFDRNDFSVLSGSLDIPEFTAIPVNTERGMFTRISIPGNTGTNVFGAPEMPAYRKLIRVPLGAQAIVNITDIQYVDIDLGKEGYPHPVYPAQPPRSKNLDQHEFVYDQSAYQLNAFSEHETLSVEMLGILRDKRIARINFVPFTYNPAEHILRVYYHIEFTVEFQNADVQATLALEEKYASICFTSVNKSLANVESQQLKENFMKYPVKYLIISDRMFENQLQPFIEWKTQKGFIVVESYTDESAVGNTPSSIKAYIQGLYESGTADDPAPSYVLFVGDVQQIPAWDNGNGETDRNYCEFTGDLFPEIYYGRFSAQNTTQLQPYIDKTLQYEKYTMPDPSYLDEVVMVAGMDGSHGYDWANGQINYGTINYFNPDHGIQSHTYLYPNSGPSAAQMRQDISDGVSFGNYTAHCSPSGWADPAFQLQHIPDLQNQDMYCVLVGNCCSSSEYAQNECFGEAIVRTANKGAVGYIGGSNSTYWDEDYYFGVGVGTISQNPPSYAETSLGYYDRAFHDHGEDFGEWYVSGDEMIFAGNLAVSESGSSREEYYWDIYNYIGDPSLMVYFSNPPVIAVSYEPLLPLQSTSFSVTTEAYAYVALSLNGELLGSALADENGIAVLEFPPLTEMGDGDVVVTKQNGQPYFGTVLISSPDGPYLMLEGVAIEDDGNQNGKADFGESLQLSLSLENAGNGEALSTVSELIGSDPYLTIHKDSHNWPDIPGQATMTEDGVFAMDVADYIPDQHTISFEIELTSATKETWMYDYDLVLNAPVLTVESMLIDDSQSGNDNGRLDPGETATILIVNNNTGHSPAPDAMATLVSSSQYLSFTSNNYEIGTLGMLGKPQAEFEVEVDADAPDGAAFAEFEYTVSSGPYTATKEFRKKIGLIIEDFETGDYTKFDWEMGGNQDWNVTEIYPYEGEYSGISGDISDNEQSELSIEVDVMIADTLSFMCKVASQLDSDYLRFYIGNSMEGEWSGIGAGWQEVKIFIPVGVHTLKWVYEKDGGGFAGADCAWLDNIILPPLMTLTCYAGPDDYTCTGSDYQCDGQATDWVAVEWTTDGDGGFDDAGILNPVYTPGTSDIAEGSVQLTMAAEDSEGAVVDDVMTLSVMDAPDIPETPDGPDFVNLYYTTESQYTTDPVPFASSYEWAVEPANAGSINGMAATGTITWNQSFLGTATISVKAVNSCGGSEYSQGFDVTVDNFTAVGEIREEKALAIYPNPNKGSFTIEMTGKDYGTIEVSIYDISGTIVYRQENISGDNGYTGQINMNTCARGMYFVKVSYKDGVFVEKLLLN